MNKAFNKGEDSSQKLKKRDSEDAEISEVVQDLKKNPKFKDFTDEQLRAVAETAVVEVRQEFLESSFSGPLPPPGVYAQYEQILPGAADRILVMAEENAQDRKKINTKIVDADIKRSLTGQILGFILSILFIGAAIVCAYFDQPFPASVLGVGGFSSIISIFVLGKK
ncbi:MAG: DUF2335 domain-containing protein [Chitinophagales bacterium]